MSDTTAEMTVEIIGADREEVLEAFRSRGLTEVQVATKQNLTGVEPTVLVLLKFATATIALITEILKGRRIKRLEAGAQAKDQPTDEDVKRLLEAGAR